MKQQSLKQLCAAATPGPWRETKASNGILSSREQAVPLIAAIQGQRGPDVCRFIAGSAQAANAHLIARLDPQTVLAVAEALDNARIYILETGSDNDMAPMIQELETALSLLNGNPPTP